MTEIELKILKTFLQMKEDRRSGILPTAESEDEKQMTKKYLEKAIKEVHSKSIYPLWKKKKNGEKELYIVTAYLTPKGTRQKAVKVEDTEGLEETEVQKKVEEAKVTLYEWLYNHYYGTESKDKTVWEVFELRQEYRLKNLNRSAGTIDRDRQAFTRVFDTEFCAKKISSYDDMSISEYINKKSEELHIKDRALQDAVRLLSSTFDFAVKNLKILSFNPVTTIDIENYYQNCDCTKKNGDDKIFTPEEIEQIKKKIRAQITKYKADFIGYAMLFSIETGVRVGEIPPLKWSDLSKLGIHIYKQQRITKVKGQPRKFEELLFTKNERRHPKGGRYFPITDEIQNILDEVKRRQEELGIDSEYIFCTEDGTWIDKEIYSQRLRRLCASLGFKITNNHAFRMSLNSNVLIPKFPNNSNIRAYLLGHSVEVNERFYSHSKTDYLIDVQAILNDNTEDTHAYSRSNIVEFRQTKSPETLENSRNFRTL
jgi:integrase